MQASVERDTRRHLAVVEQDLAREFSSLSADTVRGEVEKISSRLLSSASFPDFVPLLTRRFARDELDRLARSSELAARSPSVATP